MDELLLHKYKSFLIQRDCFMYRNLTQSLTFSPKALVSVLPTVRSLRTTRVFIFFRFFREFLGLVIAALKISSKRKNNLRRRLLSPERRCYINYGILRSIVRLFNSFLRTTRYPKFQRTDILYKIILLISCDRFLQLV